MRQLPLFDPPDLLGFKPFDRVWVDELGRAIGKLQLRDDLSPTDRVVIGRLACAFARLPRPSAGMDLTLILDLADGGLPFRRLVTFDGDGLRLESETQAAGSPRRDLTFAVGAGWRKAPGDIGAWIGALKRMADSPSTRVFTATTNHGAAMTRDDQALDDHDWWRSLET
jgi:hypothetical protein